ncbi:MAG: hypothetical protein BECKG1743F_GA0114225_109013, partial [Candidatus Kentron sp. G]
MGSPFSVLAGSTVSFVLDPSPKSRLIVTARVISGVASHIQVEETEALHVSRIALMVR